MNIIDNISYKSNLANNPVGEKLLFSLIPLILGLAFSSYVLNAVIIVFMAFSSVCFGKIDFVKYIKLLSIPASFILIGIVPITINFLDKNSIDVIFAVNFFDCNLGVTRNTLETGLEIVLKAWSCVSCFYFLTLNTPMNNLFSFMQKHGVSQMLIDLMELIYRFSFLIWNEAQRIHTAQVARLGYKDFKTSIKSLAELVTMIFENSLSRVDRINYSLESRCFNGKFSYLLEDDTSYNSVMIYGICFNILLVAIVVIERIF